MRESGQDFEFQVLAKPPHDLQHCCRHQQESEEGTHPMTCNIVVCVRKLSPLQKWREMRVAGQDFKFQETSRLESFRLFKRIRGCEK